MQHGKQAAQDGQQQCGWRPAGYDVSANAGAGAAAGVGSEVISAMALPVLGGLLIADEVVDIFLPVRFYWVRRARWLKMRKEAPSLRLH